VVLAGGAEGRDQALNMGSSGDAANVTRNDEPERASGRLTRAGTVS